MSSSPSRAFDLTCEVIGRPGTLNLDTTVFLSSWAIRSFFFFCEALAQLGAERLGGPTDPPPSYTVDAVKSRTQARVNVVRPPSPPSSSCGKLYNYILSDIFFSDVIRSGEPNASKHRVSAAVARWLRGGQDRDSKRLRRTRGTSATTSQPVDLQAPPDVDEGQQALELPFTGLRVLRDCFHSFRIN